MHCPQCHSEEFSPYGICLGCGRQITLSTLEPKPECDQDEKAGGGVSGVIEMAYSEGVHRAPSENVLPQWRRELSERLQAIKQKRETVGTAGVQRETKTPAVTASKPKGPSLVVTPQAKLLEKPPIRKTAQKPPTPPPRQKPLQPMPSGQFAAKQSSKRIESHEIQKLIDNAVSRQSSAVNTSSPVGEAPGSARRPIVDHEGKLILLSRTLSGLVDLICVVLCTGVFIIAADFFSGILVLDSTSLIGFSVLFLMTYFVYSIFFLASSSQTLGMMITDLRVVGVERKRPSLRQILGRCCGHLVSLLGLGIGLLWSLFNRESLCFHDWISGTHVIRL